MHLCCTCWEAAASLCYDGRICDCCISALVIRRGVSNRRLLSRLLGDLIPSLVLGSRDWSGPCSTETPPGGPLKKVQQRPIGGSYRYRCSIHRWISVKTVHYYRQGSASYPAPDRRKRRQRSIEWREEGKKKPQRGDRVQQQKGSPLAQPPPSRWIIQYISLELQGLRGV